MAAWQPAGKAGWLTPYCAGFGTVDDRPPSDRVGKRHFQTRTGARDFVDLHHPKVFRLGDHADQPLHRMGGGVVDLPFLSFEVLDGKAEAPEVAEYLVADPVHRSRGEAERIILDVNADPCGKLARAFLRGLPVPLPGQHCAVGGNQAAGRFLAETSEDGCDRGRVEERLQEPPPPCAAVAVMRAFLGVDLHAAS